MPTSILGWTLTIAGTLLGYELVRFALVRRVRLRLREGALDYVRRHGIHLESARFVDRLWLRENLLMDGEIAHVMARRAEEQDVPLGALRLRVEHFIDEIVPAFSLTAYYRVAGVLAKAVTEFLYEVVFDRSEVDRALADLPEGAVPVYVINHRSNADYVVLTYGLLRHVALSYAVGEWARIWPLDNLFRAFGGYFVRRGEKDGLYHKVLERYVQHVIVQGGVTGFFIEGGLSRDGRLRSPKAGLLDYIIGARRDDPDLEIAFIPVGLNFDRVLEDHTLTAEARGEVKKPGLAEKLASLAMLLAQIPVLVTANAVKVALRSHRKLGYAAISVGPPVLLSQLEEEIVAPALAPGQSLPRLPRKERRPHVDALARELLCRVSHCIPVTPVPVVCAALLAPGALDDDSVTARVQALLSRLRAAGAPVALGRAFPRLEEAASGIPGLDAAVDDLNEAQVMLLLAGYALERRELLVHDGGRFHLDPECEHILRYYANSLVHYLEDGDTAAAEDEQPDRVPG